MISSSCHEGKSIKTSRPGGCLCGLGPLGTPPPTTEERQGVNTRVPEIIASTYLSFTPDVSSSFPEKFET